MNGKLKNHLIKSLDNTKKNKKMIELSEHLIELIEAEEKIFLKRIINLQKESLGKEIELLEEILKEMEENENGKNKN